MSSSAPSSSGSVSPSSGSSGSRACCRRRQSRASRVRCSPERVLKIATIVAERIGLHGVSYSVGWSAWLDIAANGVTKASALEQIRRKLGVDPSHTIAVGDGRNDIEMLDWAARGVAMGQAPDEVADVCHEVTRTVYEDGVAEVLRSLL